MVLMLSVIVLPNSQAENPIVKNVGMADPHARFLPSWPNKLFIFATHDFSNNNTDFVMEDWWVWSTEDLRNYELISVLKPMPWVPHEALNECWATDAIERDGAVYWYLSVGPTEIAVVKSSNGPSGPWEDVLGKPLLSSSLGKKLGTQIRDPGIFMDQAGEYYIIFGTFNYFIARLSKDMVSLAEQPRPIIVENALGNYGPGKTDDKPFLHQRGGIYYLSYGCFYAVSHTSVYGPYKFVGTVIETAFLAPSFRVPQQNTSAPWWAHEDLRFRHASFLHMRGQWYYFTVDRSHSSDTAHPGFYRDVVAGYVHYYPNGSIAPVKIDSQGVGAFDGNFRIEAENFFAQKMTMKEYSIESSNNFHVNNISRGSELDYLCVSKPECARESTTRLSIQITSVEVQGFLNLSVFSSETNQPQRHQCSISLSQHDVPNTSSCLLESWPRSQSTNCMDVLLRFDGPGSARLDYFAFKCIESRD